MGEKLAEKPGSLPMASGFIISMSQGICALVAGDASNRIRSAVAVVFRRFILRLPLLNNDTYLVIPQCKFFCSPGTKRDFTKIWMQVLGMRCAYFFVYFINTIRHQSKFGIVFLCQIFIFKNVQPQLVLFDHTKWISRIQFFVSHTKLKTINE